MTWEWTDQQPHDWNLDEGAPRLLMPLRHLADTKENPFGEGITIQGF